MIYDSISNYAISVNLGHFTGFFTGIVIYDAISGYAISVKFRLFLRVSA
jgi:hypothetical protein